MFSPRDILTQGVAESTSLLNQADDKERYAELYVPEEGISVPKCTIRSNSREPGHGREQGRGLARRPTQAPRGAPGSVRLAPCTWQNSMAGLTQAAALLKGLTENEPFHRMDETLLKHLSLRFEGYPQISFRRK